MTSGRWALHSVSSLDEFCNEVDPIIWKEAKSFSTLLEKTGHKKLSETGILQGGAGAFPLLYFIVRKIKANTVVETGVASGWSSASILAALKENKNGLLYSSDLPYPHIKGSEKVVGIVVDEELKSHWKLFLNGDEISLPKILSNISSIDLFHYDSRKTFKGREFAWKLIETRLAKNAIVIYDDVQDNFHFKKLVESLNCDFRVFNFLGKFVGVFTLNATIKDALLSNDEQRKLEDKKSSESISR